MATSPKSIYAQLKQNGPPEPDDEVVIEFVFAKAKKPRDVDADLTKMLGKVRIKADPAFAKAGQPDRFIFVTLEECSADGLEPQVFELARQLGKLLGADEANAVLRDSLVGGVGVTTKMAFLGGLCSTKAREFSKGWAQGVVHVREAWSLEPTRGKGVLVADIDTGYSDHVELDGAFDKSLGINLVEGGSDARDRFSTDVMISNPGHGTLVTSVIASRGDLTPGVEPGTSGPGQVTGVAPAATVVPIRTVRSVVDLKQSRLPAAIQHAIDAGCDVITMCLGGPSRVAAVEKVIRDAVAEGIIVVCAAGNCWPWVVFPAAYSADRLCVAVAAVGHELKPWAKSARGHAVTVSAPGEDVWGASITKASDPLDVVKPSQGTTLATSMTSGVAALFVARHGGRAALKLAAQQKGTTVQDLFMRAVTFDIAPPAIWNGAGDLGAGVVNAERTLSYDISGMQKSAAVMGKHKTPRTVTPTIDILKRLAAERKVGADDEVDDALKPYASELIWHAYMGGAKGRLESAVVVAKSKSMSKKTKAPEMRSPVLSKSAASALAGKKALAGALGLDTVVAAKARPRKVAKRPRGKK